MHLFMRQRLKLICLLRAEESSDRKTLMVLLIFGINIYKWNIAHSFKLIFLEHFFEWYWLYIVLSLRALSVFFRHMWLFSFVRPWKKLKVYRNGPRVSYCCFYIFMSYLWRVRSLMTTWFVNSAFGVSSFPCEASAEWDCFVRTRMAMERRGLESIGIKRLADQVAFYG